MEPDNVFNGIFANKPSTQQKIEPQKIQEDTSAINEQTVVASPAASEQTVTESTIIFEQHALPRERKPVEVEKPVRKRGRRRKGDVSTDGSTPDKVCHFSCICDKDLIAKVRAIAWQEHMTVRAVVESMFSKCVTKYEKKRGTIQIEPNQSSEELF